MIDPVTIPPEPGAPVPADCEHGAACHDGTEPATATAPQDARSWLLIEHPGPWPARATEARLPGRLHEVAARADQLGIRVQLIRRPGRRGRAALGEAATVFAGWTAGSAPWLRRGTVRVAGGAAERDLGGELESVAAGIPPESAVAHPGPAYLVCTNARRNACCARLGLPLARALAERYPDEVWETTHVGGHRFAPNLVILPHGLYYGPVDEPHAVDAIRAHQRGEVIPGRYRGRAGQPGGEQRAEHARLTAAADAGAHPGPAAS